MFKNLFRKTAKAKEISDVPLNTKKERAVTPSRIGELGEFKIEVQLRQLPRPFTHINDVLLSNARSQTKYTQIDHILVTNYAVFVIETKNYQGNVGGERKYKNWLVNGKPTLYNPLRQNQSHVRCLQRLLSEYEGLKFISIVTFTKRAQLNIDWDLRSLDSDEFVIYDIKLTDAIEKKISMLKRDASARQLSDAEVKSVMDVILANNILDDKARKQHVERQREMANSKKSDQSK